MRAGILRVSAGLVAALFILSVTATKVSAAVVAPEVTDKDAKSAILMEQTTGKILYEKNAHEKLPPASVTKIMTLLLVMEALDDGSISLTDPVTASEHAASMGGSQVYIEAGETFSVGDLIKCVTVASGNDACVMLAEYIAGSEDGFVAMMNNRAAELGMTDTHFVNCTGLDADGHVTSAYDIALMSAELMKHKEITKYTTIWMDSIRNGAFGLSNTNKLIKTYNGITGLKTGSTSKALFCISATAKRNGLSLIAVIMAGETSDLRFKAAAKLLDFGFGAYASVDTTYTGELPRVKIAMGRQTSIVPVQEDTNPLIIEKTLSGGVKTEISVQESVSAPVEKGQKLGELIISSKDGELKRIALVAGESIKRLGFFDIFNRLLATLFMV